MRIGVVEDDPAIRRLLARALDLHDHSTVMAHDGAEALRRLGHESDVAVIVIDIGLPDSDGRDVCQALRSSGQDAPVLFLTALGGSADLLSGFEAGGDDYVTKPFAIPELLARLEALARRSTTLDARSGRATGLDLDAARHTARTERGEVLLTPTEYRMLAAVAAGGGEVVRRRAVVAAAWPDGTVPADNTVDSFLRQLRAQLESIDSPSRIETIRGVGYRLT